MPASRVYADRVLETTTTTGASDITLAGAITGYQTFNSGFGVGPYFYYAVEAVDGSGVPTGDWETGIGRLSGSTTLVRDTVLASTNSNNAVSFAAGTKRVFNSLPAYAGIRLELMGRVIARATGSALL